jgi:hypothetical protein
MEDYVKKCMKFYLKWHSSEICKSRRKVMVYLDLIGIWIDKLTLKNKVTNK